MKYKDIIFEGSTFPDAPYRWDTPPKFTKELRSEYLPELKKLALPCGFELLLEAMTAKEGFYKGTRSHVNNNPGNIGNTDGGTNKKLPTLAAGIRLQAQFIGDIVAGQKPAFPMGKPKLIAPYYSAEIARNQKTYGMEPWLPGYRFVFTGQLDQFVKIYSTGARAGNNYINLVMSHLKANGYTITPETTLQEIITLK